MKPFKVGDRVCIRTDCRYHNLGKGNPHNGVIGVVVWVGSLGNVSVRWPKDYFNNYRDIDLEYAVDDFNGNI